MLGLVRGGQAKAYPVRILNWHEIAIDRIGEESIAIAYYLLCGTRVAFLAHTAGRRLIFGVIGDAEDSIAVRGVQPASS